MKGGQIMDDLTWYEAQPRRTIGPFRAWAVFWNDVSRSRDLVTQLFIRDFTGVYKKSFLGMGWLFLAPLVGIASWLLMHSTGILKPGATVVPYPVYVLLGTTLWGLFAGFYKSAGDTLKAGSGFILQVRYPHEVLLVKQAAQQLATFLVAFALNLVVILLFGIVPSWKIVFFPLAALPLFFFGAGIGLAMAVVRIVADDLKRAFDLFLGIWIFLTPVIYSADVAHPFLRSIIRWNPLTYLVGGSRDLILHGTLGDPWAYAASAAAAFACFVLSLRFFLSSEDLMVERML